MGNIQQSNARRGGQKSVEAFSLTELTTVAAAVALLILVGMASVGKFRYESRGSACIANLRQLGVAMSLYEKSSCGRLPFAFIEYSPDKYVSWDRLIDSYTPSGPGQGCLLRCPADTIPAQGTQGTGPRRTYSMGRHNMDKWNWPPGANNNTGVGLWWSPKGRLGVPASSLNLKTNPLPAISMDMISSPSTTMIITEQAQGYNIQFSYSGATIDNPSAQLDVKHIKMSRYHGGKFNYLMVDGHVEWLSPLESLGANDPAFEDPGSKYQNVWTIKHD
jgi:prepilin-type processing-associated H-X9-DG protein